MQCFKLRNHSFPDLKKYCGMAIRSAQVQDSQHKGANDGFSVRFHQVLSLDHSFYHQELNQKLRDGFKEQLSHCALLSVASAIHNAQALKDPDPYRFAFVPGTLSKQASDWCPQNIPAKQRQL